MNHFAYISTCITFCMSIHTYAEEDSQHNDDFLSSLNKFSEAAKKKKMSYNYSDLLLEANEILITSNNIRSKLRDLDPYTDVRNIIEPFASYVNQWLFKIRKMNALPISIKNRLFIGQSAILEINHFIREFPEEKILQITAYSLCCPT